MDPSQDWFLRQLTILTDGLRGLHDRNAKTEIPEPTDSISNDDVLPVILKGMVENKQIDQAENLLFRCVENYPLVENFQIGLDFYNHLATLPREALAEAGWTTREIKDGIADLYFLIFKEHLNIEDFFKEDNNHG